MEWLILILQFAPTLISLAECIFGPKTGEQKKDAVMKSIPALAKGMEMVTTGGAKDTWTSVNQNMDKISPIIDSLVNLMYPNPEKTNTEIN